MNKTRPGILLSWLTAACAGEATMLGENTKKAHVVRILGQGRRNFLTIHKLSFNRRRGTPQAANRFEGACSTKMLDRTTGSPRIAALAEEDSSTDLLRPQKSPASPRHGCYAL